MAKAKKDNINMTIWDQVCKTDPDHTKRVEVRGGFTAICAYSQIEVATRMFGPMGIGWGYTVEYEVTGKLLLAHLRLWYQHGETRSEPIYVVGSSTLSDDGHKKACTDALTKALSYLGFNSDIFTGKYDDNKYVQGLRAEKRQAQQEAKPVPKTVAKPVPKTAPKTEAGDITDDQKAAVRSLAKKVWGDMTMVQEGPDSPKEYAYRVGLGRLFKAMKMDGANLLEWQAIKVIETLENKLERMGIEGVEVADPFEDFVPF
jgi:hypothetical protein|tara:strand:- start:7656 stop:8432 length:777 start_codon:yes stop_codon:yes gene_type:complete